MLYLPVFLEGLAEVLFFNFSTFSHELDDFSFFKFRGKSMVLNIDLLNNLVILCEFICKVISSDTFK